MGKDNGAGVNLHQIEFLLNFCKKTLFRETWNSCGSLLELKLLEELFALVTSCVVSTIHHTS